MSGHDGVKRGINKKPGRKRPLPRDVMARNLAIEKQRREALKEDFLVWFSQNVAHTSTLSCQS